MQVYILFESFYVGDLQRCTILTKLSGRAILQLDTLRRPVRRTKNKVNLCIIYKINRTFSQAHFVTYAILYCTLGNFVRFEKPSILQILRNL